MWVEKSSDQITRGFGMSRMHCKLENCPDKDKYNTLIYSITCEACYKNKMKLMNGETCRCSLIEICDECLLGEEE